TGWGDWSEVWKTTTIIEKPTVPVLASPINDSKGLLNPITSKWNSSLRVEKYIFQLSTDSLFSTFLVNDSTLTDTTLLLPTLNDYTKYYWRVKGINVGGESDWSEKRNFSTLGNPYASSLVTPINNSVNQAINGLVFRWTKANERIETIQNYQYQLSTDSLFVTLGVNDSTLTDTTTTINSLSYLTEYYWRVRAKNETGWGDWSEVWKTTTIIEKPTVPQLSTPVNNSVGLVQPVTLEWHHAERYTKYELEVSKSETFQTLAFSDTTLTDTTLILPTLENLTTYFWRVRAKNIGGMGDYSQIFSFRTLGVPTTVDLLVPKNDSIHVPLNVDFYWTKSEDRILETVSNYWFQLTTDTSSSLYVTNDSTLTDTTITVNGLTYFSEYYWRVTSKNEAGWSEFTNWSKFKTIIEKPSQIVLTTPINNSVGNVQPITLEWEVSSRAEKYEVEVASDTAFGTIVFTDTTIISTSIDLPILQNLTNYYWRVRGKNIGGIGDYSEVFTFRTLGVPTVVNLIWPVDTSINQDTVQTFRWSKAFDQIETVGRYWFELTKDSSSNSFVIQDTLLTDTLISINDLNYLTEYHWRVKANNEAGWGDFTKWNKFTTIIERPAIVNLTSPPDNQDGLIKPITFVWDSASRADYYHLQISQDSLFSNIVVEDTSVIGFQFIDSTLNDLSTYYWRVRGVNIGGKGDYSNIYSFRTLGVPYPVTLVYPPADTINLPVSITFNWLKGTDQRTVSTYWFELVRDTISMVGLVRDTTLNDTSKTVSGLINLTNYFWRVKAKNEVGWGLFSAWRKLTTIILPPVTPILSSPGSVDTIQVGVIQPTTFKWRPAVRAERYHIQISTDELFRTNAFEDSTVVDTSITLPQILQNLEFYFWRVRAINVGGTSSNSSVFKFKTIGTPFMVTLLTPTANAINQPNENLTFRWRKATEQRNIQRYWFELKRDSTSSTYTALDTAVTDTFKVINQLEYLTTYYWRVRAENEAGWSDFSFWRRLTTIIEKPDPVVLTSPLNQSINQNLMITLEWNKSPRTERYELYVAKDIAFTQMVDSNLVLTDTSYTLGPLSYFTNYYWKVRAVNINSPSEFSPTFTFSTLLPGTSLISPQNNAVDLSRYLTFKWNSAVGASHYKLQIAATSAFSNVIVDTTIAGTEINLGPLTNNSTYFWRVRSVNGSSNSEYTSPFKFTVYEPVLTITTPNGGENLRAGSSKDIKWTVRIPSFQNNNPSVRNNLIEEAEDSFTKPISGDGEVQSNFTFVILQYTTNDGATWVNIDSLVPGSQETFNWTVPQVSSENCKIRILDFTNRERGDTSDNLFTIYKPSLVLTRPNTSVVWRSGSYERIEWTSNDVQSVRVDFSTNNGASWFAINQSQPADSGGFTWNIPAITSTQCRIRILATTNLAVGDTSDVQFTVAKPDIILTSPIGGENWEAGLTYQIKWNSSYVDWVKIHYSTNSGQSWDLVVDSTSATPAIYNWTIPLLSSNTVLVRVTDGVDSVFKYTSGIFSVYRPGISVSNPTPNELVKVGIRKTIQWESNNVNLVKIDYTTDNGDSWNLIADNIQSFATGIKSYVWTVPNTPSENCIIRITDKERSANIGYSENTFIIYSAKPLIYSTLFQNPVLTKYAEVIVISDTLLSEAPKVEVAGPTSTKDIEMSQTGNSKFVYNGSLTLSSSGSHTMFVSIKTILGIESDTFRVFNIQQVLPGNSSTINSLDEKSRIHISADGVDDETY
ncbi:MAG TPA: fibronectin type III domain-containing protein, partial [Ignavibacteriaceae bacterium]|nr:fibronectin type III domain-containing protein [Ignavibacteriaceae bacterium]